MNKTELIKAIAGKVELSAKDVTAVIDAYADVIADALKAGDKVAVAGFGTYELKKKAERSGFRFQSHQEGSHRHSREQCPRPQVRQGIQGYVQLNTASAE